MKKLFTLLTIALPLYAFGADSHASEKHLFLIGGGGEPEGPTTRFDSTVGPLGRKAVAAGYLPNIHFSSGHFRTNELLSRSFDVSQDQIHPLTPETFRAFIENTAKEIAAGKYSSGDQVVFVIDSHGSYGPSPDPAHPVKCDPGQCSISLLEPLLSELNDRGVKTALVDMTCYSGATQRISAPGSCLISLAPENSQSFFSTSMKFARELESGHSLEETFLKTKEAAFGSPKINTPAGKMAEAALAPLTHSVRTGDLGIWQYERFRINPEGLLPTKSAQERLEIVLRGLPSELAEELRQAPGLAELVTAVREYDEVNKQARSQLETLIQLRKSLYGSKKPMHPCAKADLQQQIQQLEESLLETLFSFEVSTYMKDFKSPITRAARKVWKAEGPIYRKIYEFYRNQEPQLQGEGGCSDFLF